MNRYWDFQILLFFLLLTFVGSQSNRNRIIQTEASCNANNIFFRVNFQVPFRGLIYTEYAFPQCVYVNGSSEPRLSYDVEIPLRGCRTTQLPSGVWENNIIVQQDLRLLESSDQKFILNCAPAASGNSDGRFTVSFGGLTVDGSLSGTEVISGTGGAASPPDYTVQVQRGTGPNGVTVNSPLNVGDDISYVVTIQDLQGRDARIGRCWAKDDTSEIQLSDDNGCNLQKTGQVWANFRQVRSGSGKTFFNSIRAWAFPTSNRVNIFCNLHVCVGSCPQPVCSSRLRRQHQQSLLPIESQYLNTADKNNNDEEVFAIAGGFVVRSLDTAETVQANPTSSQLRDVQVVTAAPFDHSSLSSANRDDQICLNQVHFGIGLALILLIVLLSLVFMAFVMCKMCRKHYDNASTADTLSSTSRHAILSPQSHSIRGRSPALSFSSSSKNI